jgi:hypothetical protein
MAKCRFCSEKAHSKKCGKCAACCRWDKRMVPFYHPQRAAKKGQTVAEYALLLCAILVLASPAFYAFGCNLRSEPNLVAAKLSGIGR